MDPKYYAEEVIGHPNHHLKTWLDASGMCLLNTLVVSRIYLSYEIPQLTKPTSKGPLTFQGWNIDWWNRNQVKSEVSHHDLAEKKWHIFHMTSWRLQANSKNILISQVEPTPALKFLSINRHVFIQITTKITHRIHGSGIFPYMKTIQINHSCR